MPELKLTKLCSVFNQHGFEARLEGPDLTVGAVNTLENAGDGEITFLSNPKYESAVATTKASAVILKDGVPIPEGMSGIRCVDPYAGVTLAIIALHGYRQHPQWGISEGAHIDPTAKIGSDASIAASAAVSAKATIGDRCVLYPGSFVGEGARIGHDCVLFPNVVIYDHCVLGNRVTIHAGSVVGQDGLGYAPVDKKWIKIPQVGRTVIEDDVEIGANCAIDRATLGETTIGAGSKFGNVIVVGHGTTVGPDCLFVGLVAVAGSVKVGRHVTLAGLVGVAGHLSIGDDATCGGQSAIVGDIEAGSTVMGTPAIPAENWRRSVMAFPKLPELLKRVKSLEREVEALRRKADANP